MLVASSTPGSTLYNIQVNGQWFYEEPGDPRVFHFPELPTTVAHLPRLEPPQLPLPQFPTGFHYPMGIYRTTVVKLAGPDIYRDYIGQVLGEQTAVHYPAGFGGILRVALPEAATQSVNFSFSLEAGEYVAVAWQNWPEPEYGNCPPVPRPGEVTIKPGPAASRPRKGVHGYAL